MPPRGEVEHRLWTELAATGRTDSAPARAARQLARQIDGATARGEDVGDALVTLDELKATALTWGDRPPPDELSRARARRRRYGR